ncbi:MAG: Mrp/NBP35 family ATP-binding protein [Candidatus Desulforudis sp.]|nr:Mrp/NBP35 family ATP-binding protein [Desulforudis sp.]
MIGVPEEQVEKTNDGQPGAGRETSDYEPGNDLSNIKRVVAVMSGKGGVGKSSVTALLAATLARGEHRVGVLDADITGPSIPKMFGLRDRPQGFENILFPPASERLGVRVMSMNLLLPSENEPVIWRGPLIGGVIKQFWRDVVWGDLDYLLVDLPPGTSDAPLTVMQSLPLDGLVIVSSPQELAVMVVRKAFRMAEIMKTPILGLIENMTFLICPDCGKKILAFGPPQGAKVAVETGVELLATLPLDPELSRLTDAGRIEDYAATELENVPKMLAKRWAITRDPVSSS